MSLNVTLYRCAANNPCPDNLCCDKAGFCSNAADACDRSNGCQSNCKDIPDARSCKTFRHAMYPDQFKTKTRPLFAPTRSVISRFNATDKCNDVPQADYALQPCDLVEAMGGPERCKYCLYYYPHIREALESYDMTALVQPSCNSTDRQGSPRTAAFLAQIRHETNGLTQLYQSLDNGAGAIHMIPAHFQAVAQGIPRLQKAIDQLLPGLHWQNLKDDAGMQRIIGLVMSNPDTAFLTAGWWLVDGAAKRLNPDCVEVHLWVSLGGSGIKQRLEYFDEAWKVASQFKAVPLNATAAQTRRPTLVGMIVLWTTYNTGYLVDVDGEFED
ncbi:hypothetical protein BCR44DRAFT_1495279 [Catenaria anguillulae PL171]|uniref:Chitin-binding type-1 domain-containing protein n=1 Tax=Catenaria anguillulae PL171 TaxID=765915 RepID=A0A1Y2I460_9FUNG|nr:hypothetical protein BCR44DRAFT_1495279 [Catenaria anguillulae PL171]